ncbi:MAG: glycoside hydrolase family 2 TIM barrel-domain containing protein [Eubacteriales bacterium]|nr:glycoside hydrolase family 2 TIM barrel-domain containing protein [Eubacteriales bacterium]
MRKQAFSQDWICYRADAPDTQIRVDLPHDAMLTEKRSASAAGRHNIGWFEAHDYVYEKTWSVKAETKPQRYVLEVEGAYHHAEVFLNGQRLNYRPYGYSDFYTDLTEAIRPGEINTLKIKTKNSDQPNSRWYSGTGLFRPVQLYSAPIDAYIPVDGLRIKTLSHAPAAIAVETQVVGSGLLQWQIYDGDNIVASAQRQAESGVHSQRFCLPQATLWSPAEPKLYRMVVSFAEDTTEVNFGIRTLQWNPRQGLTMNGERIILRGACIHHDNGLLGAVADPDAEERKVRRLMAVGYNALRSAHNPCSKSLLDICDRLGMLVMDEYVDVWYIHKTRHDYADYMRQWWKTDLREMVKKDFNHPSVIMYSTGNEVAETAQPEGIALTQRMTRYLHHIDATRPVTCGINIFFNFLSSMGLGVYSDEKAKKESQAGERQEPVGSEFYNTLAGKFGDRFMKWGATLYPCDVKTRDAFAGMDIAGYNYGIDRYRSDLKKYPQRLILGSETFCRDAYRFWELAKRHRRIIGDFVWAGMDYMGETGVGAWEYEDYAPTGADPSGWLTAGSGRLDLLGHSGGEALYTRVALEQTDEMFLAVRPVYQQGKHSPSAWKMTDALASWSYPGCEGLPAKIEVYSRATRVRLYLNGRCLGERPTKEAVARFTVPYEDGILTAIGMDRVGREIKRVSLCSAAKETTLTIEAECFSPTAGRLLFLNLSYTDAIGQLKPMEKHRLRASVTGGKLIGFGNARPYQPDSFLTAEASTYYGRALAVVRIEDPQQLCVRLTDETQTYEYRL